MYVHYAIVCTEDNDIRYNFYFCLTALLPELIGSKVIFYGIITAGFTVKGFGELNYSLL